MASVIKETRGKRIMYRIQYRDGDKRRKSIRLSGLTRKAAEGIRAKVEALVSCRIAGQPMSTDLAGWVAKLGDDLHSKLAAADLLEPRGRQEQWTLGMLVDDFLASQAEASDSAQKNCRMACRKLVEYLGDGKPLDSITEGDAFAWQRSLTSRHATASVALYVRLAKQLFRYAVRHRRLAASPFAEVKAGSTTNRTRQQFVTREMYEKALQAAPDASWRLLLTALASAA